MKKPGDTVERYVVDALLGAGGMGEVYEARDTRLGRKVALKLLRPDAADDADERMLREARAAAGFEHPNAVVVYDVGEAEGSRYIAMELIRGRSLRAFVGDASVPLARRLRWLVDAARALAAAHRSGLVHRDVKPDNVMVRDDGVVKVLDFGIARRTGRVDPSAPTEAEAAPLPTLTAAGMIVGTPLYAAPEQLRSEPLDGRADQFAWGVTAYELCTGAPPWTAGDSVGLLSQILSGEVAPLRGAVPALPEDVERVVLRTLAKKAADRFEDLDAVADAIEPFAEAAASTGRLTGVPSTGATGTAGLGPAARPTRGRVALRWALRLGVAVLALPGVLIVGALVFGAATGKLNVIGRDGGADAGPAVVAALACSDAKVDGPSASPALARALGIGACARLAAEVGVDWRGGDGSRPLSVHVGPADGGAGVTARLELDGRVAQSTAALPLDAVAGAVRALAKDVAPPPMSDADVHAWGAKDAASARRIERLWRRIVLNLVSDDAVAIKELVEVDPASPWPHAFEALAAVGGSASLTDAADRTLARLDRLPPARALGLRGVMTYLGSRDRKEALRLMRQSYADAPDDVDIAGLYAAIAIAEGAGDEGFAVVDRLFERNPTRSIVPLDNAVSAPSDRNLARDAKYLGRLCATFPEASAWRTNVTFLVRSGRFDEARAALAFARELGGSAASSDRLSLEAAAAEIELGAFAPAAVRDVASKLLADPGLLMSTRGADLTISSYLLEGRPTEAESTAIREMDRQRDRKSPLEVAAFGTDLLRVRRLLGRPPIDADRLKVIEDAVGTDRDLTIGVRAAFVVERALVRGRIEPRKARELAEEALRELDAAAAATDDRRLRDRFALVAIPLVRLVRGDREAARRWVETDRAPSRSRARLALEAGLALEGQGDAPGAAQAYKVATDPDGVDTSPTGALIAMTRLREIHRAQHREADAQRLDDLLARLLAGAEPGLREALARVR